MHRWLQGGEAPRNHDHDVERATKELEKLGLTPEQIAEELGEWGKSEPAPPIDTLVLPESCRLAVQTFTACSTQWIFVTPGLGRPTRVGLDYLRVEVVMRAKRVPEDRWTEVFDDVRFMEAVALPLMAA